MGSKLQITLAGLALRQEEMLEKIKKILRQHQELMKGTHDQLMDLHERVVRLEDIAGKDDN